MQKGPRRRQAGGAGSPRRAAVRLQEVHRWRQACLRCGKLPLGSWAKHIRHSGHPGEGIREFLEVGCAIFPCSLGLGANQPDCALPSFAMLSSGAITQFGRGQCLGTRHLGGVKLTVPCQMRFRVGKRQAAGVEFESNLSPATRSPYPMP